MAGPETGDSTTRRVIPPGELIAGLEAAATPSTPRPRRAGKRARRLSLSSLALMVLAFAGVAIAQATVTNYLNITNHQAPFTAIAGGVFDWANSAAGGTTAGTCAHPATGTQTCTGTNGLFDGGVFSNSTTPPTAPGLTAAAAAAKASGEITDPEFKVDPLSVDHTQCALGTTNITGDPTVYTGAGSEKNGDLLSTDTWGYGSVPNKDDLSNIYAVARRTAGQYFVYFGGERVVNNGDSHIDYEFLQSKVSIQAVDVHGNATNGCTGTFTGDRTAGDVLVSVDFTKGGSTPSTLSGVTTYQWWCNAASIGSGVCNPPASGPTPGPHYEQVAVPAATVGVNNGGPVEVGGWAGRNADGTLATQALANEFMEGGIDLGSLGFHGCVSTFLPHTRSTQQFTATLKDFEIINFDTCVTPTVTTQLSSGSQSGANLVVEKGSSVSDQATLSGTVGTPGGTMTYTVYSDNACQTPANVGTGAVVGNAGAKDVTGNVAPASDPVQFDGTGTFYWQASYSGDTASGGANEAAVSPCTSETVRVVDAKIGLTPLTATNPVNSAHTITATVSQDDGLPAGAPGDGVTGFGPAPDGTTVTFSLLNNAAGATFVGGVNTCTTTGGTCTVQINTSTAGSVDIHATTTFSVGGQSLTRATGDGLSGDSANANKVYVDANIQISPLIDTNLLGVTHQLTAHVNVNYGLGGGFVNAPDGTVIDLSKVSGPGTLSATSCTTSSGTGSCSVNLTNSTTPGTTVVNATTTVTVSGFDLTRSTGDSLPGDSANAQKIWVPGSIQVTKNVTFGPFTTSATVCFQLTPTAGTSDNPQCATITSASPSHTFVWDDLPAGTYSVAETSVTAPYAALGTVASNIVLDNSTTSVTLADQDNPLPPGSLIVKKTVNGSLYTGGQGTFTFQVNSCAAGSTSTNCVSPTLVKTVDITGIGDNPTTITGLTEGWYMVHEIVPTGFTVDQNDQIVAVYAGNTSGPFTVTFNNKPSSFSQLAPTNTTCSQFASGTSTTENVINYGVKSGVINNVSPGVLFYYTKVNATTSGSFSFQMVQTMGATSPQVPLFGVQSVQVFTAAGCASNSALSTSAYTMTNSNGVVTITIPNAVAGPYYADIKIDPGTIVGSPAFTPTTVGFTYATKVSNVVVSSADGTLAPR